MGGLFLKLFIFYHVFLFKIEKIDKKYKSKYRIFLLSFKYVKLKIEREV